MPEFIHWHPTNFHNTLIYVFAEGLFMLHHKWRGAAPMSGLGTMVAAGRSGLVAGSYDGVNFMSPMQTPLTTIQRIALGPQMAVAFGYKGTGTAVVSTKDNGRTWSELTTADNPKLVSTTHRDIVYGNGQFLVVGYVGPSTNATQICLTSPDGKVWTDRTSALLTALSGSGNKGATTPTSAMFGNGIHVVGGQNWSSNQQMPGIAWSANGGVTWTAATGITTGGVGEVQLIAGVCHMGGNVWLAHAFTGNTAVPESRWYASHDNAKSWYRVTNLVTAGPTVDPYGGGVGIDGNYVVTQGIVKNMQGRISDNALLLENIVTVNTGLTNPPQSKGLAVFNRKFYACDGSAKLAMSSDGRSWSTVTMPFPINAIATYSA